jgi:hypothetical protein
MKSMVLAAAAGIAAIGLLAGPVQAQSIGRTPERVTRIFGAPAQPFNCGNSGSRHSRSVVVCGDGVGGWYGGEWALYNNRTWEADSYNDWWHDRPERAYPAWMRRNQDCARQWYSGDTLTC